MVSLIKYTLLVTCLVAAISQSYSFKLIELMKAPKFSETINLESESPADENVAAASSSNEFDSNGSQGSASPSSEEGISVILLGNETKGVPYTTEDAALSSDEYEKADSLNESEEGVGPAFEFKPAVLIGDEDGSKSPQDNEFTDSVHSDVNPIYVKPPTDFKPLIFPNRRVDGVKPGSKPFVDATVTIPAPAAPYPYPYPHGLSSWLFGGISGLQRGRFWEHLASDEALSEPSSLYSNYIPKRTSDSHSYESFLPSFPTWEDIMPKFPLMSNYRPPLPPPFPLSPMRQFQAVMKRAQIPNGLSSWLAGGLKDLTERHWDMTPMVIEKIEVVPFRNSATRSSSATSYRSPFASSSSASSSSSSSFSTFKTSGTKKFHPSTSISEDSEAPYVFSYFPQNSGPIRRNKPRDSTMKLFFDDEPESIQNTVNIEN